MANKQAGLGCLVLFSLPFAAVGVFMAGWLIQGFVTYYRMMGWEQVPATIVRAELKISHGKSTSYKAAADYTYRYHDRQYKGNRVAIQTDYDNVGPFQQTTYHELDDHRRSGKPLPCYVNPANPSESILFPRLRWELVAMQSLFAVAFGGVGFGLMIGGVKGARRTRIRNASIAARPTEPWIWNPSWAQGLIVSSSKSTMWIAIWIALVWNLISAPFFLVVPHDIFDRKNWYLLLFAAFPLIGIGLLWWAIVSVLRWVLGQSTFQMASVPGVVGGKLAGVIRTSVKIRPEDGFHVSLHCVRKITTTSGKSRNTTEKSIWQDEQLITSELLRPEDELSAIPVLFHVPYDSQPSDDEDPNDRTIWRLEASARVPGVGYRATFEVPVFMTPESDPNFVLDSSTMSQFTAPLDPNRDLREAGILKTLSPVDDGTRFIFPARAQYRYRLLPDAFLVGDVLRDRRLYLAPAPIFFPIAFGVVDVMILLGVVHMWLYSSTVDVSPRAVVITGGLFGVGKARRIESNEIGGIDVKQTMQIGSHLYYNLILCRGTTERISLGNPIPGHRLAEAIRGQFEEAMGKNIAS